MRTLRDNLWVEMRLLPLRWKLFWRGVRFRYVLWRVRRLLSKLSQP